MMAELEKASLKATQELLRQMGYMTLPEAIRKYEETVREALKKIELPAERGWLCHHPVALRL